MANATIPGAGQNGGDLNVIIGSRSALFMPLEKLGLIVIDECDNDSYDETERLPFYHAVETAEAYAKICDARLILGSATPRVTQYYKAEKGDWQLLRLPRRVPAHLEYKSALLEGGYPVCHRCISWICARNLSRATANRFRAPCRRL